ncbi:cupin domain-containing protein [Peptoniphilus catoniae]|uniref:cupin domain-containing protein n=1 Tax=Peptoniphilus catoniae TaxID=1660341 RepID=UPI0010FE421D|nr:cupin domain-containing protein [Peptoniphilus catoniae]
MRNLVKSEVFNIENIIPSVKHQTISKSLREKSESSLVLLSLAEGTDISAELYLEDKYYFLFKGRVKIGSVDLKEGELLYCSEKTLFGIYSEKESFLLEITVKFKKGDKMKNIPKGEAISLKDNVSYVEGAISNLDILSRKDLKMMLMAFDKGEGLNPHSAPGDALVVPLEGEATVTVGDKSFDLSPGRQIVFPKNINHSVRAKTEYKMLLIMAID